jgi:hypothetical protein
VSSYWSRADRRAFINEIAFHLFIECQRAEQAGNLFVDPEPLLPAAVKAARSRQEQFADRRASPPPADLTTLERLEVASLLRVLTGFSRRMSKPGSTVHLRPRFKGCGILDECEADLIIDDLLIEVKAGDRSFRAIDVRQILTYCALDRLEKKFGLACVACVNPRRGTYFRQDIETLCLQLASKPSSELLAELTYFLSSGDMSR